jgi:hypothetical protein
LSGYSKEWLQVLQSPNQIEKEPVLVLKPQAVLPMAKQQLLVSSDLPTTMLAPTQVPEMVSYVESETVSE